MTPNHDDRAELSREERTFLKRLASSFSPPPMTPAKRVAFDEALQARIERPRRSRIWVPAFATAAVAAVVAFLVFSGTFDSVPINGGREIGAVIAEAAADAQWEYELVYLPELTGSEEKADTELLPDDYLAIESVFLSG